MYVDDMADHIRHICIVENIEVHGHSRGGRAYPRRRLVKIRPVKSTITYAIALHELGHILGPNQTSKNTRLDKEVGAWEWAEVNALEWTEAMNQVRAKCLRSYLAKVARSPRMKPAAPGHAIYALV